MSLLLAVGTIFPVSANITPIIIVDIDGSFVFTSQGTFSETPALVGQFLSAGNIVTTGDNSSVQLQLNCDTLVILDANSQIAVSSSRSGFSSITVQRGSIFVNSSLQIQSDELEIRATNNVINITGSMYVVSLEHDATVTVVALDGQSNINGVTFPQRTIVSIGDDIVLHDFALDVMNLFTLQVIWNFQERLLIREHVTPEMVRSVPSFIDQRWREARVRNVSGLGGERLCAWEAINAPPSTPELTPPTQPLPSLPEIPRPPSTTPQALRL
jgi:hypothetical protein